MTGLVRKALAPAVMLTVLGGARAQDASAPSGCPECLEVRLAPIYLWAPINSTSASEAEGDPSVDVTDGTGGISAAFAARLEIHSKRWLTSMGETFATFSHESTRPSGATNALDFKISLFELYGGYEFVKHLTAGGGLRSYNGRLEFSSSTGRSVERDDRLFDPVIGLWYRPPISKHWTAEVNADVGGFGVGFDVSSSVSAVFAWRSKRFGADVGYRALYAKKSDDSGLLETTLYGPVFGFDLYF